MGYAGWEVDDLIEENERLRAVLKKIADTPPHHAGQTANEYHFQQWANEALKEEPKT
jgi:uncharacterized phage protein gp47/JayE